MISKPELPGYVRDLEIKHALRRMSPSKPGKTNEVNDDMKSRPVEER
ncbi:hypothetical protein [Alicyclobacillus dauci]|uniref:Uncharacterized protein n=1 Tax=Alicyclobacillus dauci TaxID=1475485 RepID=A0ABY6YZD7_9BACL|nr:hypothetical protein [Alicyclobacillus dauci]WAH35444.1 hypothetical protein NZD86_14175 [Alicyclobacillus dauci]